MSTLEVPGYVTIKEAAKRLSLSPSRVYEFVEEGRLSHYRVAHIILIPEDEVSRFQRGRAGRPRKSQLHWRISPDNNRLFSTTLIVPVRAQQQAALMERLEAIKQEDTHLFLGTVARFITLRDVQPMEVEIVLVWRETVMPDERQRKQALEAFQRATADIFEWEDTQYNEGIVLMHS